MGSISKSVESLATRGGLIALALVAGCGSSDGARVGENVSGSARAETAMGTSVPVTAEATVADADAPPALPVTAGDKLCAASETPFFSCEIGTKRVSVCGGARVPSIGTERPARWN